jgi:hypothetical protein
MYKEHDYDFEMELDILASLVVEMDGPDAHILEVISTIAERFQEHTVSSKNASKLVWQIVRLVQEMRKGSLPFEKGYSALPSSIQMLQRTFRIRLYRQAVVSCQAKEICPVGKRVQMDKRAPVVTQMPVTRVPTNFLLQ